MDFLKGIHVFGILSGNKTARTYQTYCTQLQKNLKTEEMILHKNHEPIKQLCCGADPDGRSLEMTRQIVSFLLVWLKLLSGKDRVANGNLSVNQL